MSLSDRLRELVSAGFAGVVVRSQEHEDAIAEVAALCSAQSWRLAVWDVERGLVAGGMPADLSRASGDASDPLAALRALRSMAAPEGAALLVMKNLHRLLGSAEIVQSLAHAVEEGRKVGAHVVLLSPTVQLPPELERQFVAVEHELPGRSQLEAIAKGVAGGPDELPTGEALAAVLDAAAGLTRVEAENAFGLSLVRHGKLAPEPLWELKTQALAKDRLLTLHRGGERFADLHGLEAVKDFCGRALRRRPPSSGRTRSATARGVVLLGVPGSGKSAFCKALGAETGRPTLVLDVGALMGSLVGQTEERTRRALAVAEAMAPCVLMVDEIEKALAGAGGPNGGNDGGVGARLLGTLLSWSSDRAGEVFLVASANDVSRLPPELLRAERFDALWFVDLPGRAEKDAMWSAYRSAYGVSPGPNPDDAGWTGAEVKSCCRLAALLDLSAIEAAGHVVPVSATAAEALDRLREWADGRCLDASRPGVYRKDRPAEPSLLDPAPRRRVNRLAPR